MATKTKAPPQKEQQEVAKKPVNDGVPEYLKTYKSTGLGVPTKAKDFLIPMAKIIDAKSPEAIKQGGNYVIGCEAGDIYIKNAPAPLVKGTSGMIFQPVKCENAVVEWRLRGKGGGGGNGFVARLHEDFLETNGKEVEMRPHPEDNKRLIPIRKATGNVLVETRYVSGYKIPGKSEEPPMPLVLTFQSTGHTVARNWNMAMALKRLYGEPVDIWLVYYKIITRMRSRADQSWFLYEITDAGPVDETNNLPTVMWAPTLEDQERGRTLFEALSKGTATFDIGASPETSDEM